MGKTVTTVAEFQTPRTGDTRRISLLDRIGGPAVVHLLVDRLIDALTKDPDLTSSLSGIDVSRLHLAQMRFFIDAFGGPGGQATPALVRVDGESLVRIVVHLHDALDSLGLPEPLTEQLLLAIAAKVLAGGPPQGS